MPCLQKTPDATVAPVIVPSAHFIVLYAQIGLNTSMMRRQGERVCLDLDSSLCTSERTHRNIENLLLVSSSIHVFDDSTTSVTSPVTPTRRALSCSTKFANIWLSPRRSVLHLGRKKSVDFQSGSDSPLAQKLERVSPLHRRRSKSDTKVSINTTTESPPSIIPLDESSSNLRNEGFRPQDKKLDGMDCWQSEDKRKDLFTMVDGNHILPESERGENDTETCIQRHDASTGSLKKGHCMYHPATTAHDRFTGARRPGMLLRKQASERYLNMQKAKSNRGDLQDLLNEYDILTSAES